MYLAISFMFFGLMGTLLALRLMAIDAQEHGTRLTVRGRIVFGVIIGIGFALFILLISGFWWDCDLRANATSPCRVYWSY